MGAQGAEPDLWAIVNAIRAGDMELAAALRAELRDLPELDDLGGLEDVGGLEDLGGLDDVALDVEEIDLGEWADDAERTIRKEYAALEKADSILCGILGIDPGDDVDLSVDYDQLEAAGFHVPRTITEEDADGVAINRRILSKSSTGGRPSYELTPEGADFVAFLAAHGLNQKEIAEALGVGLRTLTSSTNGARFRDAMQRGRGRKRNASKKGKALVWFLPAEASELDGSRTLPRTPSPAGAGRTPTFNAT